jgi:hypothetical protein
MTDMTDFKQNLINFKKWDETKGKFRKFHFANPHIYQTFSIYSWDAANVGHKVFSHWLIMNRIRWDSLIQTDGEKYKIPNEFIAFYARMFMIRHPQLGAFFKIKRMKGEPYDVWLRSQNKLAESDNRTAA